MREGREIPESKTISIAKSNCLNRLYQNTKAIQEESAIFVKQNVRNQDPQRYYVVRGI